MYVNKMDFDKYKKENTILIDYTPKESLITKSRKSPNVILEEMKSNDSGNIYLCDNIQDHKYILNGIKTTCSI